MGWQERQAEASGIVIVGGGGHATVVAEAALAAGLRLSGFLDDAPTARLGGFAERIGGMMMLESGEFLSRRALILGLGDIGLRERLAARLNGRAATVVHPRAFVSPSASLEEGVFIGPGAIIHTHARIGAHATVNSGAVVEHDCVIGVNAHVAPGAVLGGAVRVGDHTLIGLGSRALPGVRIGARCVVGAGAAVLSDVEDGQLVVGVPARPLER